VSHITTSSASDELPDVLAAPVLSDDEFPELEVSVLPPHAVIPTTIVAITNNAVNFLFI
jgi:hypothetical protein